MQKGSLNQFPNEPATVGIAESSNIEDAVRTAVELCGGFDFIKPGQKVMIKPNVNTGDSPPFSTNVEVVKAVAGLVLERHPSKLLIGEKSMTARKTLVEMKKAGFLELGLNLQVDVVPFDDAPWVKVKPKNGKAWPEGFSVPSIVFDMDHIISVPVVKTHWTATFSIALKNQVGFISDYDRGFLPHGVRGNDTLFADLIAEISLAVKHVFVVTDATKCLVAGRGSAGRICSPGLIFATLDIVANDVVGLSLLKHLGTEPKVQDMSVRGQPQIRSAV